MSKKKLASKLCISTKIKDEASKEVSKWSGKNPNLFWKTLDWNDDIFKNGRFIRLDITDGNSDLIDFKQYCETGRYYLVPPGSFYWKKIREFNPEEKPTASGSRFSNLLGLWERGTLKLMGGKTQYANHDNLVNSIKKLKGLNVEDTFTLQTRKWMEWGVNNEINALANVLDTFKDSTLLEVGFFKLEESKIPVSSEATELLSGNIPSIGATPDGILIDSEAKKWIVECKCPAPFFLSAKGGDGVYDYRSRIPHKEIPYYYIPQIQIQMLCTNIKSSLYVSYTPTKGTKIYEMKYNAKFCKTMIYLLSYIYKNCVKKDGEIKDDFYLNSKVSRLYLSFLNQLKDLQGSSNLLFYKERSYQSKKYTKIFY